MGLIRAISWYHTRNAKDVLCYFQYVVVVRNMNGVNVTQSYTCRCSFQLMRFKWPRKEPFSLHPLPVFLWLFFLCFCFGFFCFCFGFFLLSRCFFLIRLRTLARDGRLVLVLFFGLPTSNLNALYIFPTLLKNPGGSVEAPQGVECASPRSCIATAQESTPTRISNCPVTMTTPWRFWRYTVGLRARVVYISQITLGKSIIFISVYNSN